MQAHMETQHSLLTAARDAWLAAWKPLLIASLLVLAGIAARSYLMSTLADLRFEYIIEFEATPERLPEFPIVLTRPARYPGLVHLRCDRADAARAGNAAHANRLRVRCESLETADADYDGFPLGDVFSERAGWRWPSGYDLNGSTVLDDPKLVAISWLPMLLIAIVLGWRYDWRAEGQALRRLRLSALLHLPLPWLAGVGSALALVTAGTALGWLPPPRVEPETHLAVFGSSSMAYMLLLTPFPEEMVFRGWLYQRLVGRIPVWLLALAGTDLFLILHIGTAFEMPYPLPYLGSVFVVSMTLYWLRWRHGSLLLCIAAHLLANGAAVVIAHAVQAQLAG